MKKHSILVLIVGVVVGALVTQFWPRAFSGADEVDSNSDGKADTWFTYKSDVLVASAEDRDFDGRQDAWHSYVNGVIDFTKSDDSFDGKIESWVYYRHGVPERVDRDLDRDTSVDVIECYVHGQLSSQKWVNASGVTTRLQTFDLGVKRTELLDLDADGVFDQSIAFDRYERPIRKTGLGKDAQPENRTRLEIAR